MPADTRSVLGAAGRPDIDRGRAKTAFLCLRDWSTFRNVLTPDAVRVMAESPHLYVVLSPDPNNELLRRALPGRNFVFERLNLVPAEDVRAGKVYRPLSLIRHFAYGNTRFSEIGARQHHIALYRKETLARSNIKGLMAGEATLLAARLASRSRFMRDAVRAVEARLYPVDMHGDLYRKYRPSLVVLPSIGYSSDAFLMREARRHDARVLSIVRSWDNTTTKGIPAAIPDHVFAWTRLMREELMRLHDVPESSIDICGIPHWDDYFRDIKMRNRGEFLDHHGLRGDCRIVYYAMMAPSHFRENMNLIRAMASAVQSGRIPRSQLLVRIHPNYYVSPKWSKGLAEMQQFLAGLRAETGGRVQISEQHVEHIGDLTILSPANQTALKEIYTYSDVMVNILSTQMIEAALFDLPIVNVGHLQWREMQVPISALWSWDHLHRVNSTGAIVTSVSDEHLCDAIVDALDHRERLSACRHRLAQQEVDSHRGGAGEATGRRLVDLVSGP